MSEFKEILAEKTGKEKEEKSPISLYVSARQLPEISKWPLGKEYTFKAKMVSKTESVREDGEDSASFEITSWEGGKSEMKTDDKSSEKDEEYDD